MVVAPTNMQKSEVVMDKSKRPVCFAGYHTMLPVPRYYLHGQADPTDDWFVNVEPLEQRCREIGLGN